MKKWFVSEQLPASSKFWILAILGTVFLSHSSLLFPKFLQNPDSFIIYPILETIGSPSEYVEKLVSFELMDFQPIRDLTLFIDYYFYEATGFQSVIILNCLIWFAILWQIFLILRDRYGFEARVAGPLVLAISVYPIYLQTVNWGIARKHLLAMVFILAATRSLFAWAERREGRLRVVVYYFLSALSIPSSILWPGFAGLYLWRHGRLRESRDLLITLFLTLALVAGINFAYYKTSLTYLEIYPQKASFFSPAIVAMNLGLQFHQIFLPYKLSFTYALGYTAILGLVLLAAFLVLVGILRKRHPDILLWFAYGALHLVLYLTTPNVYFDPYVIQSTLAVFFILFLGFRSFLEKHTVVALPLVLVWGVLTFLQNPVWGEKVEFFRRSHEAYPDCLNAIDLAKLEYLEKSSLNQDLYDFIQENQCTKVIALDSPYLKAKKMYLEALQLFQEESIDWEFRRSRLEDLAGKHIAPMTIYMAFLAKNDLATDLEDIAERVNLSLGGRELDLPAEAFFAREVVPYCKERALVHCQEFIARLKPSRHSIYRPKD